MRRKILGLTAIVLALSLSAFHAGPVYKKLPSYFWFPLDPGSGQPQGVRTLSYLPYDPYSCTNWGWGTYCAGGYSSYSGTDGNYFAGGDEVLLDFHPFD